jgi:hypothetical protein
MIPGLWLVVAVLTAGDPPLRADPAALAGIPPEVLQRVQADPYAYFRFINREWSARACEVLADDVGGEALARLHGDAHLAQYAYNDQAWGLDDFDDSARGPALVDIVRFLGSIDLVTRHRGWADARTRLFDRFFAGYRMGLSDPAFQPPEPAVVKRLRAGDTTRTQAAWLASTDALMEPMREAPMQGVIAGMEAFSRVVRRERPARPESYFQVVKAGWLRLGIGSAALPKVLIRLQGPSPGADDDVIVEAKAARSLDGIRCLDLAGTHPGVRVVAGATQVGRLRHEILAAGPDLAIREMPGQSEHLRNWWLRSWEASYREVTVDDFASVDEMSDVVYDAAVQLGSGWLHGSTGTAQVTLRKRSLDLLSRSEARLRQTATTMVEDLLLGWRELAR